MDSSVAQDPQALSPDPSKVTLTNELDLFTELYCTCISGQWPTGGAVGTCGGFVMML